MTGILVPALGRALPGLIAMRSAATLALLAAVVVGAALPAAAETPADTVAETQVITTHYDCDRGVEVPVTYVTAADAAVAVLNLEGRQITLFAEPAASGTRYGWPSDGASYVWLGKGDEAMLLWKEAGEETPVLGGCHRAG